MTIVMACRSTPAASSVDSIGGSNTAFGTGRVTSDTTIATRWPGRTARLRGAPAIGDASAALTAAAGSGRAGTRAGCSTVALSGTSARISPSPYGSSTCMSRW
jgi:uracil-DNA glycosylase